MTSELVRALLYALLAWWYLGGALRELPHAPLHPHRLAFYAVGFLLSAGAFVHNVVIGT